MFFCHLDVSLSTKIKQIRSGKICSWIPVEGYQGNKRFLFPESFVRVGGGGGEGWEGWSQLNTLNVCVSLPDFV